MSTLGPWSNLSIADNALPLDTGPTLGLWSNLTVVDSSVVLPAILEPWSNLAVANWPPTPRQILVDGVWKNTKRIMLGD